MTLRAQSAALQAEALAFVMRALLDEESAAHEVAFRTGATMAEVELGAPDLYDPNAQRFAREFDLQQIRSFSARTAAVVRVEIQRGISEGLNERKLVSRLADQLAGRSAHNLRTIARTELHRAANWGRYSGWVKSRVVDLKEYHATLDGRVRPGHLAAHGERVPIREPFTRGDARGYIMPPIAPNCRCTASAASAFGSDFTSEARDVRGVIVVRESPRVREARRLQEEFQRKNAQQARKRQGLSAAPCPVHFAARDLPGEITGLRALEERHVANMEAVLMTWPRVLFREARRRAVGTFHVVSRSVEA